MKLRDRHKRISYDIKQTDYKANVTFIDTFSATVNELIVWIRNIQQEDTKGDSSLLQQGDKIAGLSIMNIL